MFQKKHTWQISSYMVKEFPVLELTDSVSGDIGRRDLYLEFMKGLPRTGDLFSISQSFLPSQVRKQDYRIVSGELNKLNLLYLAATKEYSTTETDLSAGQDYVVHAFEPNLDKKIQEMYFVAGTTLSNVMYSHNRLDSDWLAKVVELNKVFLDWFWLKSDDTAIEGLVAQVNQLLWTAEGHLCILARDRKEFGEYWLLLLDIARKFSLTLEIAPSSSN